MFFIDKKTSYYSLLLQILQASKQENKNVRNSNMLKCFTEAINVILIYFSNKNLYSVIVSKTTFMVIQGEFVDAMKWILSENFNVPENS